MPDALTIIGWTLTVVGAAWLAVALLVAWAAHRTRADFDHHVNTAPGFTLEEQIAAFPSEVERMVRREVAG